MGNLAVKLRNLVNNRLLALACVLFLLYVLTACSEGESPVQPAPAPDDCASTAVLENNACRTFAVRIDERADTPFVEGGQPASLEVVLFRPLQAGRYPTLVFHHGSTGSGSDSSQFRLTFTSKAIAAWFVDRGWMVAFPQRRGRGQSDGIYDEGFEPDRSGYSCRADLALAGAERALDDLDAVTDWLLNRMDVETGRLLVGGTSRGGILAIVHLARRPEAYRAAINFVGGWLGEGCGDFRSVNQSLFIAGANPASASLWLYAAHDAFYSLEHSRGNFQTFLSAEGNGEFLEFSRAPGLEGHFLFNDPLLWSNAMSSFIARF